MHNTHLRLDVMDQTTSRRRFVKAAVLMPVVSGLTVPSLLAESVIAHAQARKNGVRRLNVFAIGSDTRRLKHKWFDHGEWYDWENLGSTFAFGNGAIPGVASWGQGRLDVFAISSDKTLRHKWFDNGIWSSWESLGGNFLSVPAVVSW